MICGANVNFDSLLTSVTSLETDLLSGMAKDALELKTELEAKLAGVVGDLRSLIPELPTIPSISLQTGIQDLLNMAPGSTEYLSKLASLKVDFEDGLIAAGQDLLGLISGAGTTSVCEAIPNFEMDALGAVVEKAQNVLQAQIPVIKEKLSVIGDEATVELIKNRWNTGKTAIDTAIAAATTPASVKASYEVSTIDG